MKKPSRSLSFLLSFLLIFEQSGLLAGRQAYAQMAASLDLSAHFSSLSSSLTQEKFRPLHLRYLSYDSVNNNFQLLLDKGSLIKPSPDKLKDEAKQLLNYFFIGISLPNESFWVNLRPDSPDNILDPLVEETDIGKVLLEADVQLKKDTAGYTNPQTPIGREYWDKLYKKAQELFGSENISIPTLTRPWIVPDEIIIRESAGSSDVSRSPEQAKRLEGSSPEQAKRLEGSSPEQAKRLEGSSPEQATRVEGPNAYIYKATLKVMLEEDYLKSSQFSAISFQQDYSFKDRRLKILNQYSSELIRELIIPKLIQDVNTAKRYASLRQVYYSLILSQWFKQKFQDKPSKYSNLINQKSLDNLRSQEPWDKALYFDQYQQSFKQGEYNLKEPQATPYGQVIRSYMSGGIDLAGEKLSLASSSILSNRGLLKNIGLIGFGFSNGVFIPVKEKLTDFMTEEELALVKTKLASQKNILKKIFINSQGFPDWTVEELRTRDLGLDELSELMGGQVISEKQRIPDHPLGSGLEPKDMIEWPARRLAEEIVKFGGKTVWSNAFGPYFLGLLWEKDNVYYLTALKEEDYRIYPLGSPMDGGEPSNKNTLGKVLLETFKEDIKSEEKGYIVHLSRNNNNIYDLELQLLDMKSRDKLASLEIATNDLLKHNGYYELGLIKSEESNSGYGSELLRRLNDVFFNSGLKGAVGVVLNEKTLEQLRQNINFRDTLMGRLIQKGGWRITSVKYIDQYGIEFYDPFLSVMLREEEEARRDPLLKIGHVEVLVEPGNASASSSLYGDHGSSVINERYAKYAVFPEGMTEDEKRSFLSGKEIMPSIKDTRGFRLREGRYPNFDTALSTVSRKFSGKVLSDDQDISFFHKIQKLVLARKQNKSYVVDWGAGNLAAAVGLFNMLPDENLNIFAFGNTYGKNMNDFPDSVVPIFDTADNLTKHLEKRLSPGGKIDAIYSWRGIHFLIDSPKGDYFLTYLKSLRGMLSTDGFIVFNVTTDLKYKICQGLAPELEKIFKTVRLTWDAREDMGYVFLEGVKNGFPEASSALSVMPEGYVITESGRMDFKTLAPDKNNPAYRTKFAVGQESVGEITFYRDYPDRVIFNNILIDPGFRSKGKHFARYMLEVLMRGMAQFKFGNIPSRIKGYVLNPLMASLMEQYGFKPYLETEMAKSLAMVVIMGETAAENEKIPLYINENDPAKIRSFEKSMTAEENKQAYSIFELVPEKISGKVVTVSATYIFDDFPEKAPGSVDHFGPQIVWNEWINQSSSSVVKETVNGLTLWLSGRIGGPQRTEEGKVYFIKNARVDYGVEGKPVVYKGSYQGPVLEFHGAVSNGRWVVKGTDIAVSDYIRALESENITEIFILGCNPEGSGKILVPEGMKVHYATSDIEYVSMDNDISWEGYFELMNSAQASGASVWGIGCIAKGWKTVSGSNSSPYNNYMPESYRDWHKQVPEDFISGLEKEYGPIRRIADVIKIEPEETVTVDMSEYTVINNSPEIRYLHTYGIGPCIVLAIWDVRNKSGALAHINFAIDIEKSLDNILHFLETGDAGTNGFRAKVIGGMKDNSEYRLYQIVQYLKKNRIKIDYLDIFDSDRTTAVMDLRDGKIYQADDYWDIPISDADAFSSYLKYISPISNRKKIQKEKEEGKGSSPIAGYNKDDNNPGFISDPSLHSGSMPQTSKRGGVSDPSLHLGSMPQTSKRGGVSDPSLHSGSMPQTSKRGSVSDPSLHSGSMPQTSKRGGIDLRSLPVVTQPMPALMSNPQARTAAPIALRGLSSAELSSQWQEIEDMLQAGIIPSSDRIKDYLQGCGGSQEGFNLEVDKVISCLADIFRLEEERVVYTEPMLKEILTLLESDQPVSQTQLALSGLQPIKKR